MDAKSGRPGRSVARTILVVGAVVLVMLLVIGIVVAGVVVVAAVADLESPQAWSRLADVGQAFGALESLMSGLAFVALIITLWVQFRELRLQQSELRQQRDAIERSNGELRRSAEANMRMLHFELIRMSIEDPGLADVWPHPVAVGDLGERRQFIYANLIYQHMSLTMRVADEPDETVRRQLRHLFGSPAMRAYWLASAEERAVMLAPGSHDLRIARIGDEVCADLERERDAV